MDEWRPCAPDVPIDCQELGTYMISHVALKSPKDDLQSIKHTDLRPASLCCGCCTIRFFHPLDSKYVDKDSPEQYFCHRQTTERARGAFAA